MIPRAAALNEMRGLLGWRPLYLLAIPLLGSVAVPIALAIRDGQHFVPGGLQIETDGAQGTIDASHYNMTLPVAIYNGTERVILGVSLWVEAYACPSDDAALSRCQKILATEQRMPLRLMPGGSAQMSQSLAGDAPSDVPGQHLRIIRKLDRVEDDRDLPHHLHPGD